MIPVIDTERLILRGPEPRDADPFIAFFGSDRAAFVGGKKTPGEAWRMFAAEIGHWTMRGFGMWSVTLKPSDRAIGLVGAWHPIDWPEQEIGWLMWPAGEGRGLAFEAAQAARDHLLGPAGWTTAVSYIDPGNARSIRLAERLGAVPDPDAERPHPNDLVFRHPAPEQRPS